MTTSELERRLSEATGLLRHARDRIEHATVSGARQAELDKQLLSAISRAIATQEPTNGKHPQEMKTNV